MWPMVSKQESSPTTPDAEALGLACLRAKAVNLTRSCGRMESQLAGVRGTTEGCASEVVPQTDVPQDCWS